MSVLEKPRQILSVIVRGRKLKGNKEGRFLPLPLKQCEHIGIYPGDLLEIEIKKISRAHPPAPAPARDVAFAHTLNEVSVKPSLVDID